MTTAQTTKMTDRRLLKEASARGDFLLHTEWVGTNGLIWTWQDDSRTLDTRRLTYRTKRAALDSYADYLRYSG